MKHSGQLFRGPVVEEASWHGPIFGRLELELTLVMAVVQVLVHQPGEVKVQEQVWEQDQGKERGQTWVQVRMELVEWVEDWEQGTPPTAAEAVQVPPMLA